MLTASPGAAPAFPPVLDDVVTPAVLIDLPRMRARVDGMAKRASDAGVGLRPHAKTHKCTQVAREQLEAGAVGLTVATLAEAEVFALAGCRDVFVAFPVWPSAGNIAPLLRLHDQIELRVGVDSAEGADALAQVSRGGSPLRVMLEVDCGQHRSGVAAEAVHHLARHCLALGLDVRGVFTHPGHAYVSPDAVAAAARDEQRCLRVGSDSLRRLLDVPVEVSGGSTPTAALRPFGAMTEVRPGTYVFGDAQQIRLGTVTAADVALAVAARVVSRPRPGQAVLDAGSKCLSSDRPSWMNSFGVLPGWPDATVTSLTEQHAVVHGLDPDVRVGDVVAIYPNHVCTAVNLAPELLVLSEGRIVDAWTVDAKDRPSKRAHVSSA
jgi:D-serine deaminase-like pyridoxal phosphate-dependent protein